MGKILFAAVSLAMMALPTLAYSQANTAAGVGAGVGIGAAVGGPPGAVVGGIVGGTVGASTEPRYAGEPVYAGRHRVCWRDMNGFRRCRWR